MANLILNGSTSGSVTLSSPAVSGTTTLTLPITSGTVITTGSTFAGTGPAFSAYANALQSISTSTDTKVILQAEEWDTANCFDSTTNYRFTPNVAGYYQINAMCRMHVASSVVMSNTHLSLFKNGSVYKRAQEFGNANQDGVQIVLSEMVYFNGSTDYIELYGYIQTIGSPRFQGDVGQPYAPRMSGFLARAA